MSYGKNTTLVNEIIDFVKAGRLLKPVKYLLTHIVAIRDLEKARDMAMKQTYGVDEYLWTDIREIEMSRVKGVGYALEDFSDPRKELSENIKFFTSCLRHSLDESYRDLLDDIVSDLYSCAFARAVQGETPGFFEILFEIYKAGGWPCGWRGNYPQGNVVGFFPRLSDDEVKEK